MNARDEIAKALNEHADSLGDVYLNAMDTVYRPLADKLVAALEAAGFTIAKLVPIGWEYRDDEWPDWRWQLTAARRVHWKKRRRVYRLEGE